MGAKIKFPIRVYDERLEKYKYLTSDGMKWSFLLFAQTREEDLEIRRKTVASS